MFSDEQFNTLVSLIKDMIKNKDRSTIIIVICIIGFCLFYMLLMNLFIPLLLNKSNRKNEITKIKIERKLSVIEKVLENLRMINSLLNNIDDKTQIINNITNLRKYVFVHNYQIPKKMNIEIVKLIDYFVTVLENPFARNTELEDAFFDKIYKQYEILK